MAERGSSSACRSAGHELRSRGVPRVTPPITLLPLTDAEDAEFAEIMSPRPPASGRSR